MSFTGRQLIAELEKYPKFLDLPVRVRIVHQDEYESTACGISYIASADLSHAIVISGSDMEVYSHEDLG